MFNLEERNFKEPGKKRGKSYSEEKYKTKRITTNYLLREKKSANQKMIERYLQVLKAKKKKKPINLKFYTFEDIPQK